ncbi:DNA replication inhibitor plutonium [Ceratitis capitata]|uniref:DNA replication inhibitor plutonium n=1 Tax=Ceratitis capitata TaxID=7213 RepID=W8C142_CERCA|nr:DNA replication inhibitor plutonium [Ceratitis capitata]
MSVIRCVEERDTSSLRAILAQQRHNPKKFDLEETDKYGNTPLLRACYLAKVEHADLLIRHGASLKAINYLGQNALTLATYAGSLDVVRLLLRYRSYTDFNKSSIVPALCVACLRQNQTLINFFKRFPATAEEVKTAHGLSPAQIRQWAEIYNKSRSAQGGPSSSAAYRMR